MSKTKYLYICGMGHSGSTILDHALGTEKGFITTAQLNDLFNPYNPCGDINSNCKEFWQDIVSALDDQTISEITSWHRSVSRERFLLPMIFSPKARISFCRATLPLYRQVLHSSGSRILIDSSKNVTRAVAIGSSNLFESYIIHLIRDVRGLVASVNSRQDRAKKKRTWAVPAMHWLAKNVAASSILPRTSFRYSQVKLEELLLHPDKTLDKMEVFLGERLPEARKVFKGIVPLEMSNSIGFGGNRVLHSRASTYITQSAAHSIAAGPNIFADVVLGAMSWVWGYPFSMTKNMD